MNNRYRRTYAEINLSNIYDNYTTVQNIAIGKGVIPVVKANAYGHGAVEVVRYLLEKGIDYFAVSLLEEALELRSLFPEINILVMGIVEGQGLVIASENNITITISNLDQFKNVRNLIETLKIHVKINTGMNRLGFTSQSDIESALKFMVSNYPSILIEGIYTHFSTADVDKSYYDIQMRRFKKVLELLSYDFQMIHVSNSSSGIKYEGNLEFTTHIRLGISLYGLSLDGFDFLKPAFKLVTRISQINKLSSGQKVGYGATYETIGTEYIGVLPIGYADGFIRKNQGGDVEIDGVRFPIVGRVCMDQSFIRINENIVKENDVVLFGGIISIDEVADRLETINYEVVCQVTSRVPRIYIK